MIMRIMDYELTIYITLAASSILTKKKTNPNIVTYIENWGPWGK